MATSLEEEKSEFNPAKLRLKIYHVLQPAQVNKLGIYIYIQHTHTHTKCCYWQIIDYIEIWSQIK